VGQLEGNAEYLVLYLVFMVAYPGRRPVFDTRPTVIPFMLHPYLTLNVMSRVNPNLVVPFDPVAILVVAWNPDPFPLLWDVLLDDFPMTGWFMNNRGWVVDTPFMSPVRGNDRGECAVLKEVVQGYRPESDSKPFPPAPPAVSRKRDGRQCENHQSNQSD
jgi:hypothetical protein